ncbi:molybdate ABC transporter ATP-binding protein ModF [Vibrio alginolyticus]|uniref:Molybdate ABC transporter ATP-binding protein ModF n=1 Tax=Vibrio alginolyticus TaxID=663 RepID=A0A7Y0N0L4_VIBAL|nr:MULTISPECIES: molybdate ABC transporter ATP-binding protein ModF [Vibrio]EGR1564459.1 molybdate ABC transporter ATP-binding protein ModF [Vibrio alginolyticus]EHA1206446.1 molybdate ABC transporter ATP-binding protein ModF [Vibrio alginolyticus]EHI5142871.1 molybdate ABC transporter ATP-binding protein ModF [Vibrio alginolyticus]ELA6773534.1 molybdate ABC transporter ATP-binding protein ModF [Vibrio alginolyticus]ELA8364098.1 molybdate ABC transporter ATP-binding protein ModF [Vibrio algino
MTIHFRQLAAKRNTTHLFIDDWKINTQQSWGIFSADGDIGSLLGDLICDEMSPNSGEIELNGLSVAQVSLSEQQRLLERELEKDDTDFLDRIDQGSTVYSLILEQSQDTNLTEQLVNDLDLSHLRDSGFRVLSTGETRRVMLARALATQPDLVLLDNPFTGLDIAHRAALARYLHSLSQNVQLLITFSRESDMPEWINSIALFSAGKLDSTMDKSSWDNHPIIGQIKSQSEQQSEEMMSLIRQHQHSTPFNNPIFELKNGAVEYTDKKIFTGLNWRIDKGQHWQVKGPNGCGKSTLLGLIFGDHPQCYSNDIDIFGKKRGTGETIWEIKQHIGMVSSALHLQYRVNCSALEVILSGFYDSIGLYNQPTRKEMDIANEWLDILHMSQYKKTSFKQLEYGQQRLLLIARAIVKQPTLLILDEPYQGLDFLGRRLVKNTLELIARENLSQLLYVSHYQEDRLDSIKNELEFVFDENAQCYRANVYQS